MDIQQEIKLIEEELLGLIIAHLENNKIDTIKAQQLAKDFLAILPVSDQKDLLGKLKTLSGTYNEAKELYVDELSRVSDTQRDQVLAKMRDAIQQGDIEKAVTIAKTMQE